MDGPLADRTRLSRIIERGAKTRKIRPDHLHHREQRYALFLQAATEERTQGVLPVRVLEGVHCDLLNFVQHILMQLQPTPEYKMLSAVGAD